MKKAERFKIVRGDDEYVAAWMSNIIFGKPDVFKGEYKTLACADGDGNILAAVLYNNFCHRIDGSPLSLEMSVASVDKRWANRHTLYAFFYYPFIQLGLDRVMTQCSAERDNVIKFNKRLGFVKEGYHRNGWILGGDSLSFGMLKEECRWINGKQ